MRFPGRPVVGEYWKATCYAQVVLAHRKPLDREFLFRCYSNPIHDCHRPRTQMIQYAVTVIIALEGRGVLDAPPEPVIGRAFARPVGGA